ncbi:restriction endonuclease subunit S [Pseudomonas sp. 25 R 14]|uniref:restriction endonuclease subunit S n=1 Tax=Pseudomonas sp. 25 R 14 TaxID=1844109 RepID=UPI000811FA5D|nr:restriction endonuclease subunit S [Pseudomonas sp. 25 R 14]CRM38572.1 Type I restriction enzyme EcoKI specificity protein [Pseudomonas sp. 25 R 14]
MTFPCYPKYKDSGVEWLGDVPEQWTLSRGDAYISSISKLVSAESLNDKEIFHYSIPVVQASGDGQLEDGSEIDSSKLLVQRRQVLISKLNPRKNTVCLARPHDALTVCSGEFVPLQSDTLNHKWLYYLVGSENFRKRLESLVESATRSHQRVNPSDILKFQGAFPSLLEQTQIARFLDHETARIDALIKEQKRLIGLLKEKRQAVISHAVTKGLDPTVPTKDSGVEWLGAVPAHWDVVPTNYRYEIQLGRMLNEQRAQGDHLKPYLRVFDVQWNAINTTDLPLMDFPPEAQSMYRLKSGDLMVNEGGSYVGRSAIWRGDLDECYYQKALHRLRPRDLKRDTAEFFLHVMEMATQQGVFVAGGNQTTIDHLTAEQLRQYRFAFPPLEEQVHIAEKITAVVSKIQNTTSKAEELIGYLQERRSALISAAVTGKIDVRGWQPPVRSQSPELAQEVV